MLIGNSSLKVIQSERLRYDDESKCNSIQKNMYVSDDKSNCYKNIYMRYKNILFLFSIDHF